MPTGHETLDQTLGGGWPVGMLPELLVEGSGLGEVGLLLPALTRLLSDEPREENRWIMWVGPPHVPYAPALSAAGLDLDRLFVIRARACEDIVWAAEQAIQSGVCAAVLAWPDDTGEPAAVRALRRLQLAAAESRCHVFVYRHRRHAAQAAPAPLRICLRPENHRLVLDILNRRGGGATRLTVPRC